MSIRRKPGAYLWVKEFDADYKRVCVSLGIDDLVAGSETCRTNHSTCGDARARLYFTAMYEDGASVVKAYCHNCATGTARRLTGRISYIDLPPPAAAAGEDTDRQVLLPGDFVSIRDKAGDVPRGALQWLAAQGLDLAYVQLFNVGWSTSLGRVVLPIYHDDYKITVNTTGGRLIGYQARAIPGARTSAKYITHMGDEPLTSAFHNTSPSKGLMVWTEDMVSSMRVAQDGPIFGGSVGVPLFGLGIRPDNIIKRMKQFPHHVPVVWLDNDVPAAIEAREHLAKLLGAIGRTPHVIQNLREPKKLPPSHLKDELRAMHSTLVK